VPTGTADQKLAGVGAPLPPGATQPSGPVEPAAVSAPIGAAGGSR